MRSLCSVDVQVVRRWLTALALVLVVGCSTSVGRLQRQSSGFVGCAPREIRIVNADISAQLDTWTAMCRGRRFFCSNSKASTVNQLQCTEEMPQRRRR